MMNSTTPNIKKSTPAPLQVPVSRRELAAHYFPSPTAESAVRRLSRWLHDDPDLLHALEAAGYHAKQRNFTRRQVAVFQFYFGP